MILTKTHLSNTIKEQLNYFRCLSILKRFPLRDNPTIYVGTDSKEMEMKIFIPL